MPSENLGLAYIGSYMKKNGIKVDILDANMLEISAKRINKYFDYKKYILIGIGVSSNLLIYEAIEIAQEIKKLNKNIHITIGGHFASFQHYEILKNYINIDSVVRKDGEETIVELVDSLYIGAELKNINGLSYRDHNGNIIVNIDRELIADLNKIPWPSRDSLNYLQELGHSWPTQITSSRGCYGNCSFCDIRAFYGRSWRGRSAIDVVNEIEYLHNRFGSKMFRFTDDEFIGPKPHGVKRAEKIANELIKRNIKVELMIDARVQAVEKKLFRLLKKAGVTNCLVGIESGVDRILKLYNKGTSVAKNIYAIEILKDIGIRIDLAYIMFDPRLTLQELNQNYQFIKENDIITTESLKSWLWPLDGTPIRRQLIDEGLINLRPFNNYSYNFLDPYVDHIFRFIEKCKEITFELERKLFLSKKHLLLNEIEFENVSKKNLNLWINIFESCLSNPEISDVNGIVKKTKSIINQII